MEPENINAAIQDDAPDLPLSEPHFEDEATLLSARPVVPLHEVEPPMSRLTRGWLLAATVFGAMFLGALGSLLYLSLTNRESAPSFIESEALTAGVVGEVSEPASSAQPTSGQREKVIPDGDGEIVDSQPAQPNQAAQSEDEASKPAARRVDVITYRPTREERKAARRLAKEEKRDLERQNRKARDLTRIREIFEGTQRP